MLKFVLVIILLIISSSVIYGQKIEDFILEDMDRQNVALSDVQGKNLTIIDFWATWCLPCHEAMKVLSKIRPDLLNHGVEIVGINVDSPRNTSKVKPFVKSMGIEYPILMDLNQDVMTELGVSVLPTIIIINENKIILYAKEGYQAGDEKVLREEIEKLLGNED